MVFEIFKIKLLGIQLKRAKEASKRETAKAKLRAVATKKKLMIEKEQQKLRDEIRQAKKLKLTPSEKKLLQKRLDRNEAQKRQAIKAIALSGRAIGKATVSTVSFLNKFAERIEGPAPKPRRKKTTKKKSVKKKNGRRK